MEGNGHSRWGDTAGPWGVLNGFGCVEDAGRERDREGEGEEERPQPPLRWRYRGTLPGGVCWEDNTQDRMATTQQEEASRGDGAGGTRDNTFKS